MDRGGVGQRGRSWSSRKRSFYVTKRHRKDLSRWASCKSSNLASQKLHTNNTAKDLCFNSRTGSPNHKPLPAGFISWRSRNARNKQAPFRKLSRRRPRALCGDRGVSVVRITRVAIGPQGTSVLAMLEFRPPTNNGLVCFTSTLTPELAYYPIG